MSQVSLEQKTLLYWELSSSFNDRIQLPIPFQTAVKITGDLLNSLDPHRPLALRVRQIDDELIHQTSMPKTEPCSVTFLASTGGNLA